MFDLKAKPFYLDDSAIDWIKNTLSGMNIEEKCGQLFCVLYGGFENEHERINSILSPGGAMFRPMDVETAVNTCRTIQQTSKIPMLIAANLEKGGNGIVKGGTIFGSPMEVSATRDIGMASKMGSLCAAEGKAVGANWSFAPIVDIDLNFRNPITNTRTFGSDPEWVEKLGHAYMDEIQKAGMAACIKHFPGDGCDERDQHLCTTVNDLDCDSWDAKYGKIYRSLIEAGALTCMVGHIMLPSYSRRLNPSLLDEEILPCTLSKELMTGLLRGKLGFNGLIVTDATTMAGYTMPMSRKKAVPTSIAAGADMFLFSRNLEEDYGYMMQGIKDGLITQQRLDEAVTRILALKAALGLHKKITLPSAREAASIIACEKHKEWARECADKAITIVKEEPGVLPITPERYKKVLFYALEPAPGGGGQYYVIPACSKLMDLLRKEGFDIDLFAPQPLMEGQATKFSEMIEKYDLIIYAANYTTKSNQTVVRIEWQEPLGANCAHYKNDIPTVFISLENPYHLLDVPRVKTYINTYNSNDAVLRMLVEKLTGRSEFKGTSPVDPFCGKWDARL